uniref:Uncharacterized protein n=1 Tax=Vombatus ursinus TaxID=29139 RepID=A0A4X2L0I9_VOMUR
MSYHQQKQPNIIPPQLQQHQVKQPCQPPPQEPCHPRPCYPEVPVPSQPKVPEPGTTKVPVSYPTTVTPPIAQDKYPQVPKTKQK